MDLFLAVSVGELSELDKKWKLSLKQINVISKSMYFTEADGFGQAFAPMSYQAGDDNDYYSAYCAVKHDRINALYKANINTLVRALGALFILNVYYSFETIEMDRINTFDFSLGSEVFMAKYTMNKCEPYALLTVMEDTEYLKKLEEYSCAIPDILNKDFFEIYR